jgi:hypothetical protein
VCVLCVWEREKGREEKREREGKSVCGRVRAIETQRGRASERETERESEKNQGIQFNFFPFHEHIHELFMNIFQKNYRFFFLDFKNTVAKGTLTISGGKNS